MTTLLPHQILLDVVLVGGCIFLQPGEISPGQNGVLFLNEPSNLQPDCPGSYVTISLIQGNYLFRSKINSGIQIGRVIIIVIELILRSELLISFYSKPQIHFYLP